MKKPATQAYTTAIPAASVGVKTPHQIPPMMITGITRDGIARRVPAKISRNVARGSREYPSRRATITM